MLVCAFAWIYYLEARWTYALHYAAARGDLERVTVLIQRGANPNKVLAGSGNDRLFKATPLHAACIGRNPSVVSALLVAGGDPNVRDGYWRSPLDYAVANDDIASVRALLEHKAEVNIPDRAGQLPLQLAIEIASVEMVRVLINAGADVNADSGSRYSPLDALDFAYEPNGLAGDAFDQKCELLLAAGAKPCRVFPLLAAVRRCDERAITLLLDAGADPNGRDPESGDSLVSLAQRLRCPRVADLLQAGGTGRATDHGPP